MGMQGTRPMYRLHTRDHTPSLPEHFHTFYRKCAVVHMFAAWELEVSIARANRRDVKFWGSIEAHPQRIRYCSCGRLNMRLDASTAQSASSTFKQMSVLSTISSRQCRAEDAHDEFLSSLTVADTG
jgi:hypothetical protein